MAQLSHIEGDRTLIETLSAKVSPNTSETEPVKNTVKLLLSIASLHQFQLAI